MSDDDLENDVDPDEDPNIRRLREKAKRADTLEPENTDLKKMLAVYETGISGLNKRQVRALVREIDGDPTEEAVREAATELGFWKADSGEQGVSAEELEAMRQTQQASVGASPPNSGDVASRYQQAMDAAQTEEEWQAVVDEFGPELGMRRS